MRTTLAVLAVALVGLFGAVSLGYAAYVVSRDQVGLPVTKLKTPPGSLAATPAKTTKRPARNRKASCRRHLLHLRRRPESRVTITAGARGAAQAPATAAGAAMTRACPATR